jgi:hypothetical protein
MQRWAMIILLTLATSVEALELPSEVDLRAAYCIPIIQRSVDEMMSGENSVKDPEQKARLAYSLSKARTDLRRLRMYLVPRIEHLDPFELAVASKRGKEALVEENEYLNQCAPKCGRIDNEFSEWGPCLMKCFTGNPVRTRTKACFDLSWLPF